MARAPAKRGLLVLLAAAFLAAGCGNEPAHSPPPGPGAQPTPPVPIGPGAQGLSQVTVTASSNPSGATVTGGGRPLGTTPLSAQVPVPAPRPGQPPQVFEFTFAKEGYLSASLQAAPVNGQLAIVASLAPQPSDPGKQEETDSEADEVEDDPEEGDGPVVVRGRGGGPILDNQTTTSRARVERDCTVGRLTVTLRGQHSYHSDLTVSLRSPQGRQFILQRGSSRDPFRSYRVAGARGLEARGRWVLSIADTVGQDTGRLRAFSMRLTCR